MYTIYNSNIKDKSRSTQEKIKRADKSSIQTGGLNVFTVHMITVKGIPMYEVKTPNGFKLPKTRRYSEIYAQRIADALNSKLGRG